MTETIRIFIGTEEKTEIARKVLEHSIRRHTSADVQFTPMIGPEWEYPLDGIKVGTGFSLRRWMIPDACDYEGRAIYLDADQLVFTDIKRLWDKPVTQPVPGASVYCTFQPDKYSKKPWPQTSVMVIDCKAAEWEWGWRIGEILAYLKTKPNDRVSYADFMHCAVSGPGRVWWTKKAPVQIDTAWNDLNEYRHGKTCLLHYTKEDSQPWYNPAHPHAKHWHHALTLAIQDCAVEKAEFEFALSQWNKQEDWRKMNGLHPYYERFLKLFKI